jgi:hypothetical protein
MKQAVARSGDHAALRALLERSVRFGHKRLALQRCLMAERMGIALSEDLLGYCRTVAEGMTRQQLAALVLALPRIAPTI